MRYRNIRNGSVISTDFKVNDDRWVPVLLQQEPVLVESETVKKTEPKKSSKKKGK